MKTTKKALISSVLALFLCFSMLVGTTYAWFTDSVTSAGNIITAGTLDVTMEWAEGNEDPTNTTWTDASTGAMFDYANWEPGYVEAKHIKISNVGSLALNYKLRIVANGIVSKLANVIDVYVFDQAEKIDRSSFEGKTPLGNLAQVLGSGEGSTQVLHKHVKGGLEAGDVRDLTLALKMKESAGNEYQGLELGTFSIELIATQQSFENDSFGKDYDAVVPDESIPYAFVTELDDLDITYTMGIGGAESTTTLAAGYKFEPTIGDELNDNDPSTNNEYTSDSKYMNWHTDFYVYADKDIDTSKIMLAGWYSAWCDAINGGKWVALSGNPGDVLAANEGIRLVKLLGNGGICVTYEDIYNYGNDGKGFQCGLAAVDAAAYEALIGTTITVELRLYETEGKWNDATHTCSEVTPENYITAGKFTYTFAEEVKTADEFKDAIANGVEGIRLENDVVLDSKVTIDKNQALTLDLNGKTLAAAFDNHGGSALLDNSGSLTIINGTVVSLAEFPDTDWGTEGFPTYATNTISNKGNLVIGAGAVIENQTNVGGASYAIDNYAGATVTIEEGAVIKAKDVAIRMFANSATAEDKVVINGGTITGKRAVWVQLPSSNAAVAPLATLEINGGELNATSGLVIYSYSYGNSFANTNVTITGGTFNGDVAFGGGYKGDAETVTVTGGTFNGELGRYLDNDGWADIAKP